MSRPNMFSHAGLRHSLSVFLIGLLFFSLSAMDVLAKKSQKKWDYKRDVKIDLLYGATYDNNAMAFSDYDLDRFDDGTLPLVTEVETYDDLYHNLGVKFGVHTPKILGNRKGYLSYTYSYRAHTKNQFLDRSTHTLYGRHDLVKRVDLFGTYIFIPNRYLRDYYDKDHGRVAATEFAYRLGSVGTRFSVKQLKGFTFALRYDFYTIYYNPLFTEYDAEGYGIRFDTNYRVNSNLRLSLILKRRWTDNVGFEANNDAVGVIDDIDSEYGDGSNGEEWYEFGARYTIKEKFGRDFNVNVYARLRYRFYTSDLSIEDDPFHRSREHWMNRYHVDVSTKVMKNLRVSPFFELETRRTDSPLDRVKDVKDYDTFRTGMNFTYSF